MTIIVNGWKSLEEKLAPLQQRLAELLNSRRKCAPKIRWATRGQAETQMHDVLTNGKEKDKSRIHTYECPHCHGWHVGHRALPKRRQNG